MQLRREYPVEKIILNLSRSLSLSFLLPYCADISLELHECVRDEQMVFLLLAAA